MPILNLELLDWQLRYQLPELPAASSIVSFNGHVFLVGDNSLFLLVIDGEGQRTQFSLVPEAEMGHEPLPKKEKPDFEGMILDPARGELMVLPSGSKKSRFTGARVSLKQANLPAVAVDFHPLFKRIKKAVGISKEDLNIEGGGLLSQDRWFLLNRGNGPNRQNLIIVLEGTDLLTAELVASHTLLLPKLDGIMATSTDGLVHDGMLFVVAAAEATISTFDDGDVAGSLIACFDLVDFALCGYCRLPSAVKIEGISLLATQDNRLTLLLCSDQDDPQIPGQVYRAELVWKR